MSEISPALRGMLDILRAKHGKRRPHEHDLSGLMHRKIETTMRERYREEQSDTAAPFIDLGGES